MKKTLELTAKQARDLHKTSSFEWKEVLENNFGKEFFSQSIMDRVKTYEDAMGETSRPSVPDFSNVPEDMRAYHEALYKMTVIAEALNEGWTPNWDNSNEYKWRPWFVMSPSGFAFYTSNYDYSLALAGSGSRLCFKTEALATYAAKQFLDLWKSIQLK